MAEVLVLPVPIIASELGDIPSCALVCSTSGIRLENAMMSSNGSTSLGHPIGKLMGIEASAFVSEGSCWWWPEALRVRSGT